MLVSPAITHADDGGYPWVNATYVDSNYDWGYNPCPSNDGGCMAMPVNGYGTADPWVYNLRNCTSYVAWKINQQFTKNINGWGNASSWNGSALNAGYYDDSIPQVGDIAQWNSPAPYGHVGYVYAVNNGVANLDEYNVAGTGLFSSNRTTASNSAGAPSNFIHIGTPSGGGSQPNPASPFDTTGINVNGVQQLFMISPTDKQLYTNYQVAANGAWSGWTSLGGLWNASGKITVGNNADGRLEVFLVGTDGKLYTSYETSVNGSTLWSGWTSLNGAWSATGSLTVRNNADGRMQLFMISPTDSQLYTNYQVAVNGSWSGWSSLNGAWSLTGSIAVRSNADGRMQVLLVGTDGQMYTNYETSTNASAAWSGWTSLSGAWPANDTLGINNNADGRLEVFLIGGDGKLYTNYETSVNGTSWSGWVSLSGSWPSNKSLAVANNADGRMQIFSTGSDNQLYTNYQVAANGSWSGWTSLSGAWPANAMIRIANNADGRLEVYLVGGDNQLYANYETSVNGSTSWAGWVPLGGSW